MASHLILTAALQGKDCECLYFTNEEVEGPSGQPVL